MKKLVVLEVTTSLPNVQISTVALLAVLLHLFNSFISQHPHKWQQLWDTCVPNGVEIRKGRYDQNFSLQNHMETKVINYLFFKQMSLYRTYSILKIDIKWDSISCWEQCLGDILYHPCLKSKPIRHLSKTSDIILTARVIHLICSGNNFCWHFANWRLHANVGVFFPLH